MSKLNLCGFKPDPKPPAPPELGARCSIRLCLGDAEHPTRTGTVSYINIPHRWFLVTFDGGLRRAITSGRLNYGYNNVHFRADRRCHRRRVAFADRRSYREEEPP